MDPAEYCRAIESHLCRRNEGHLIRIVGPVFETVIGWASQGIPLAVACKGIDQYCERYYAKGPRRRPVRVEFCEADVLETFDNWRRAVGVSPPSEGDAAEKRSDSLPSHIDRAIVRLTALRAGRAPDALSIQLDDTVRELDALKTSARQSRGDARAGIVDRLSALDAALIERGGAALDDHRRAALRSSAEAEIAPFALRMAPEACAAAVDAAFTRLLRAALGLPTIAFV
jgi:hypothetical protein